MISTFCTHLLPLMFGTAYRVSSQQDSMRELLHDLARARPLTRSFALCRFAHVLTLSCAVFRPCSPSHSLSFSLCLCRLRTHSFSARILFGISIIFTVSFSTLRRSAADGWQLLTVKLFRQFFVSAKTCAYFRSHCELFLLLL